MPARKKSIKRKVRNWTAADSAELYGVENWSNDYFSVSRAGEVNVHLVDTDGSTKEVSLPDIMKGLEERGTNVPVLLRFRDLLHARIDELNKSFSKAIKAAGYTGKYRGVYPIKVNQQRMVVEEVVAHGQKYHYGLEAGSKPELIAAMAYVFWRYSLFFQNQVLLDILLQQFLYRICCRHAKNLLFAH